MQNTFKNNDATIRERAGGITSKLGNIGGIMALGLLTAVLGACNNEPNKEAVAPAPPVATQTTEAVAPPPTTSVNNVADNPTKLVGQTVTLKGEVDEIVGPRSFRLEGQQLFNNEKVLVINVNPATPITDDNEVSVTGTVRNFVLAEFEKDYDLQWDLDVKKKIEAEYQNKPVVVAQTVQKLEND